MRSPVRRIYADICRQIDRDRERDRDIERQRQRQREREKCVRHFAIYICRNMQIDRDKERQREIGRKRDCLKISVQQYPT